MTTERLEVQRTIAADPATIFRVLCDPQGHVAIDSSGMLIDGHGRARDRRRRQLRRAHGPRGAERLPDGPLRRDRHDHDVRSRPRDRVDGRRRRSARRSATSTATRSSPSTTARSSPRTTTGRRSTRRGRRRGSSRSCPRARCAPPWGSSPGRWLGAVSPRQADSMLESRASRRRQLDPDRLRSGSTTVVRPVSSSRRESPRAARSPARRAGRRSLGTDPVREQPGCSSKERGGRPDGVVLRSGRRGGEAEPPPPRLSGDPDLGRRRRIPTPVAAKTRQS